jgi:hypothetical protein
MRRIARRGERVIGRQVPTGAIVRSFEPVFDAQMTAQHLAAKPALKADDMVTLHRSLDRNRRNKSLLQRCFSSETAEGSLHR